MDDEVARCEAGDVAEREAAFDAAALAGRRPVVAVEDLVVGVDREPLFGQDEPLVHRLDGEHGVGLVVLVAEEFAEAGALALAVAEDVRFVAAVFQFGEVRAEPADVAVEVGLRLRFERERALGVVRERAEEEAGAAGEPLAELIAGEVESVGLRRVAVVERGEGLGRFGMERVGAVVEPGFVEEGEEGRLGEIVEQGDVRHLVVRRRAEVGDDARLRHPAHRALRLRVELADRVDLVAEELDADGVVAGEGVDVEDAAAQRELARQRDELDGLEPLLDEPLHQRLRPDLIADAHRQRFLRHRLRRGDELRDRRHARHDDAVEPLFEPLQHVRALDQRGVLGDLLAVVRLLPARRE